VVGALWKPQTLTPGFWPFAKYTPQLVTLDLVMPINDGIDAAHLSRIIREESPATVLLVVSSFAANRDLQTFFQKQGVELFEKTSADGPKFDKLFARLDTLFPQVAAHSGRLLHKTPPKRGAPPPWRERIRVLVVEDNPTNQP
jgi:CheY-like chemotaxis protein